VRSDGADAGTRRLLGGGALVLGADALQLPSAILLAAYLSRRLGAEGLALYLLAASLVLAVELVVGALLSRATVQLVAETRDWEPAASLSLRWHAGASAALTAGLLLAVAPFEAPLGVPGLRAVLWIFALEIPLFGLARAHAHVLVGLGRFRERARAEAVRSVGRLALALTLVEAGLSVRGAALAAVGSTALELAAARAGVRIRWRAPAPDGLRRELLRYSTPLFLHGLALQLYHRLGLLLLVPLGTSVAAAGVYGAAESLMRLRRILGQSLTPLLLSSLTRLRRDGAEQEARALARNGLRAVFWTLPPVAAIAGAARPVMSWLFGPEFAGGGPILALLVWGAPAFLAISIATAILVAGNRPGATARLTVPMAPLALAGYLVVVPERGPLGAAAVTTGIVLLAALACLAAVRALWGVAPSPGTVARGAAAALLAYSLARALPAGGAWLLVELPAVAAIGCALQLLLGEASREELGRLKRWVAGARGTGV
jgi:O-antigen/teichoic acid export membrane protein